MKEGWRVEAFALGMCLYLKMGIMECTIRLSIGQDGEQFFRRHFYWLSKAAR